MKLKLLPDNTQKQALLDVMERFNEACNYVSNIAFSKGVLTQVALQSIVYYDVREKFDLSAQMTIRCIGKVTESYKAEKKHLHHFRPHGAMVYDSRIYRILNGDTISILTLEGRIKVPFIFCDYREMGLDIRRVKTQADLILVDGTFYFVVVVDVPERPKIATDDFIGVDLGVVNIATDSDGEQHSGSHINSLRKRHQKLRRELQSKGTRSAKRKLKRRRRKETRFANDVNHCISKKLVAKAQDTGRGIALEDLQGIRDRTTVRKSQRRQHASWRFFDLRIKIEYKAQLAGIPVLLVDPKHTSQECSSCGHISKANRRTQSEFLCESCGFSDHADHNAAVNIGRRAVVNQPNESTPDEVQLAFSVTHGEAEAVSTELRLSVVTSPRASALGS